MAIGDEGEIGVWSKEQVGKPEKGQPLRKSLAGKGQWKMPNRPVQAAIFAKGRAMVFYSRADHEKPRISLQHVDQDCTEPTNPIDLPSFDIDEDDDLAMLLAVSDIDDGHSGRGRRTQRAVVMGVSKSGQAWCWRITSRYIATSNSEVELDDDRPDIELLHTYRLPIQGGGDPAWVLPVDPMGWHQSIIDWKTDNPLQDMVLTISKTGVLEYWQPRLCQHLASDKHINRNGDGKAGNHHSDSSQSWIRSGSVDTSRSSIVAARCSSRKKTVLSESSSN